MIKSYYIPTKWGLVLVWGISVRKQRNGDSEKYLAHNHIDKELWLIFFSYMPPRLFLFSEVQLYL